MATITYIVKIASGKFTIDDAVAPKLTFRDGDTYVFDQADNSNSGHILQFSATANNSGSSEYTTGVTKTGTAGSAGAKTTIVTSGSTTDTLYYYSSGGGDHGSEFSNSGFKTSSNFNFLKPIIGGPNTAEKWGSMVNHAIDQIDQNISAQDLDGATDSGTVAVDLDTQSLTVAGSNGIATSGSGQTITISGEALAYQGEPHIIPGVLYPAVAGNDLDGTDIDTSHGSTYTYGTTHTDGRMYYYTDIKGSKPIKDPRIGGHFGSQRHKCRSIQLLEQETAIHGKNVYSVDGREWCRAVDSITRPNDTWGGHYVSIDASGSFVEFTGYFTDVNISTYTSSGRHCEYQLDGGSASTSNFGVASVNSPLVNRAVDPSSVINLGLGATLGIHTIRINHDASSTNVFGIELIAQDTSSTANKSKIQIPSQNVVSYGKKFTVSGTPHYDPFNGFTSGTDISGYIDEATSLGMSNWKVSSTWYRPFNGGRVVKWVDSSGNIKTSVNMMPPNAQNIGTTASNAIDLSSSQTNDDTINFNTSAIDNSLSEVAKTFHWREFGNGAANQGTGQTYADASMLSGTADDIAYVMDDGLTSLSGDDNAVGTSGTTQAIFPSDDGDTIYITFIGTGITLINTHSSHLWTTTFAQNLPYGTHILKIARDGDANPDYTIDGIALNDVSNGSYGSFTECSFHQPKKPPIPEDAVVLCDFMLMADFVPTTSSTLGNISKGVRLSSGSRDTFYDSGATITYNQGYVDSLPTASSLYTLNSVSEAKLPAFATSFGMFYDRYSDRHNNVHVKLDGSTFSYDTNNIYDTNGDWDDTNDDGTIDKSASNVPSLYGIKNLTLGLHTFGDKNETAVAGDYNSWGAIEVGNPIHTSSHYQTFETPYLHELVGGDRNMEQNNLVVTPDGKTWDEVTRDTSYLGNIGLNASGASSTANNHMIFDEWRGRQETYRDMFNKDFAIAYDRVICLKDGFYNIATNSYAYSGDRHQGTISVNGTEIFVAANSASGGDGGEASVFLKRGDYVQVTGYSEADAYSHFTITKV